MRNKLSNRYHANAYFEAAEKELVTEKDKNNGVKLLMMFSIGSTVHAIKGSVNIDKTVVLVTNEEDKAETQEWSYIDNFYNLTAYVKKNDKWQKGLQNGAAWARSTAESVFACATALGNGYGDIRMSAELCTVAEQCYRQTITIEGITFSKYIFYAEYVNPFELDIAVKDNIGKLDVIYTDCDTNYLKFKDIFGRSEMSVDENGVVCEDYGRYIDTLKEQDPNYKLEYCLHPTLLAS